MIKKTISAALLAAYFIVPTFAHADETPTEKVENAQGDAKVDAKKMHRKHKKHLRDATGHSSTSEDAKDQLKNADDSMRNSGEKLKRKAD